MLGVCFCVLLQPLMLQMLLLGDASALAVSTARACLPHWMEAAAWVVALATDATAAHMGRLPSSKLPPKPRSMVAEVGTVRAVWRLTHEPRHQTPTCLTICLVLKAPLTLRMPPTGPITALYLN